MADALTEILRAASKHPNSRVSKHIQLVEEEPTQKNIVLLLIELAEHADYSIDFNVSLKYYLDLFERFGINHDLVLNEAGLLLVNSSKIYSKRVDYVQSLVERQILTLSNADDELQKQKLEQQQTENANPVEKPKRGRKRALEAPSDPYEVELAPKKFKKLTEEKRFALPKTVPKAKSMLRNIEMEQHIHPAGWQCATIYDFENEEDVDTKRNYKLFTYHVEHRYNTLVPDINFRLHFKVKDYMDEQEEMDEHEANNADRSWPPLSEAYVQKYLRLENYVLQQDIKANKRNVLDHEEGTKKQENIIIDPTDESQQNFNNANINETLNCKNNVELELSTLDASAVNASSETSLSNKTQGDVGNLNEKNDSSLFQSMLNETNNTLDSNQYNCTLKTPSTAENLNSIISEADKSLNAEQSQTVDDSALGTSVLDQSGHTENDATENPEHVNKSNVNQSDLREVHSSLDITKSQLENDSALGTSVLDQTVNLESNTTAETINSNISEVNKSLNTSECQTVNDSLLGISVLDKSDNTESNTSDNLENINITTSKDNLNDSDQGEVNSSLNVTKNQLENDSAFGTSMLDQTTSFENSATVKVTKNIEATQKNECETASGVSSGIDTTVQEGNDDIHHLSSRENVADESGNSLKIDVIQQQDKKNTQIRVQLPNGDDEGVYFSDLEEHDYRLLSPVIKTSNILPGVKRKEVTIVIDEELRQALEMRDGIMKHFGHETFTVPVITEAKRQNLVFNILKLPDNVLRKKVLFKLGPEMDLYIKARSMKRSKPELIKRESRKCQNMQWYTLNSTDMTGVYMTPPCSPGHSSDFCGFSVNEDDCAEFIGFTEEEQSKLTLKPLCRLSRDSGVGVDVNNLTPDKESSENIFVSKESVESILTQLPAEIRDILATELEESSENNSSIGEKNRETAAQSNKLNVDLLSSNNNKETEKLSTQIMIENSETVLTENFSVNNTQVSNETSEPLTPSNHSKESESSTQIPISAKTENSSPNNTQESDAVLSINSELLPTTDTPNDVEADIETPNNVMALQNTDAELSCDESSNIEKYNKTVEEPIKEKLDFAKNMELNDNCRDHHVDVEINDSDDYVMLDLNKQGNKTKIQQWHEHLQPILAKSRERHHFDVYKLGTEIIDTVKSKAKSLNEPSNELKSGDASPSSPVASFHDIMDNNDTSYVSRYFLSTLLLANQSNIEILIQNKSSEKPSSWHDINLKLLSTKRHTVAIEDNIGMIDSKQKSRVQTIKHQTSKQIQNKTAANHHQDDDNEEDEFLMKLQSVDKSYVKLKTVLKRSSSDNATTSCTADKKHKENSFAVSSANSRNEKLPSLIESVQIIMPPLANTPLSMDTSVMPSTSRQAQKINNAFFNVNINTIRTLQPIEKVQKRSDDIDSGIFSIDEMSTS